MSGLSTVTNLLFRRTSAFALTTIVAAFFFERAFDVATESLYAQMNKGKTWNEIKDRYVSE